MSQAKVTVVIVNYNGEEFVLNAIRSAAHQFERCYIVIVDNASSDQSVLSLRRLTGVQLIENPVNVGFGAAANLAARQVRTEYIAFLNSDAVARRNWLSEIVPWMDSARIDFGSSVVQSNSLNWFAGGRWRPALGAALLLSHYKGQRTDWLSGCALIAKTGSFQALGGFDEGFFLYYEDVDLSLRAGAAGYRLGLHPCPLVNHDVSGRSAQELGFRKQEIAYESKGRLIAKHISPSLQPLALAFQATAGPLSNGVAPFFLPRVGRSLMRGYMHFKSESRGAVRHAEAASYEKDRSQQETCRR
jgi:GT2 family glycosyltransferase